MNPQVATVTELIRRHNRLEMEKSRNPRSNKNFLIWGSFSGDTYLNYLTAGPFPALQDSGELK